ncbi:helix-turn-helix domain-containing protein [Cellulomonas sp. URHE0023]|uniref:helix-turn-helix domain-containing protein n=1 Tax=Cellulomonas sp. URHE0023 TaxID=1380354 RepID=UPI0009E043E8|nr:helix-turn-helix domain-containing protein [Cellulomonas sp. URHE0023]
MSRPTSTLLPVGPSRPAPGRTRPPEPLLRHLVGAILRARREDQGRTLRDVAESARVSVAYLSEVERGRKEPSSEVLVAVCRALGLRLVDLVGTAHAELARAEGRVVVDLTAPADTELVATPTDPVALGGRHEPATVTRLSGRAPTTMPEATLVTAGTVGAVLLAA